MTARSLLENVKVEQILDPVTLTADAACTVVDLKGYGGATIIALIGETGNTLDGSNFLELELEDSTAAATSFVDCTDAELSASVTGTTTGTFGVVNAAADDDTAYSTTYRGDKRYLKCKLNFTGDHSSGQPVAVVALKHGKQYLPVS